MHRSCGKRKLFDDFAACPSLTGVNGPTLLVVVQQGPDPQLALVSPGCKQGPPSTFPAYDLYKNTIDDIYIPILIYFIIPFISY